MIREHDTIALLQDLPAQQLRRGDVGVIVQVYAADKGFEVEFVDERGKTRCVATVTPAMIMRLNFLRQSA